MTSVHRSCDVSNPVEKAKGRLQPQGLLARLLRDTAGNAFVIVAAAVVPLLALVGGGIDMGRSYLTETRLQQACDSGVLAARKSLGSQVAVDGAIPAVASTAGNRFFNLNFRSGAYGTNSRSFDMALESDYSVSGEASAVVPTTVMRVFGEEKVTVNVKCEAKLNFSNTDVMMVLDTTGSMNETNSGDSAPKISILRTVAKDFFKEITASKTPGVRIRFGFVPYSTNVNVGYLLKSGWMRDSATYEGRIAKSTGATQTVPKYKYTYTYMSGTKAAITAYTAASCPSSTAVYPWIAYGSGTGYEVWDTRANGDEISCTYADGHFTVSGTRYTNYVYRTLKQNDGTETKEVYKWQYKGVAVDVTSLKDSDPEKPFKGGQVKVRMLGDPSPSPDWMTANFRGCIEERETYQITDYNNVDLSKALDLDIDLVPDPTKAKTQWTPMLNEISFLRAWKPTGGSWSKKTVTTADNYMRSFDYGLTACPRAARKLSEMDQSSFDAYMDSLYPAGSTYHDIGMIWGGRLLSPTGLFASENADLSGQPTRRHLIFLTDGQTAPLDLSYGTYGVEPLSERRWSPSSPYNLTQTVENRFSFACKEVKKKNITVWVIGFGTTMTDMLKTCAGDGHWFQADDSTELTKAFSTIAKSMGDLRIIQ